MRVSFGPELWDDVLSYLRDVVSWLGERETAWLCRSY